MVFAMNLSTFSITHTNKPFGSCFLRQHNFLQSLHPIIRRAPVILMAAATAGFGVAAYCDEEEDEVDEELVVTAPAPEYCEREENLLAPECSGDFLGGPNSDGSTVPGMDPLDGNTGGGQGIPDNPQDEDEDGKQDCWNDLTSNENAEITSPLGNRDRDGDGEEEYHNGIDVGVATGTRLYAAKSGTVKATERRLPEGSRTYTNENGEEVEVPNGNYVRINWDDGTQGVYLHMKTVQTGLDDNPEVEVGDYLGRSNDTGNSDGPHLHYSEWNNQDTDRPDGASEDSDNFNDPEEVHGDCEADEGEGAGDA